MEKIICENCLKETNEIFFIEGLDISVCNTCRENCEIKYSLSDLIKEIDMIKDYRSLK